jgi:hypothetical protein
MVRQSVTLTNSLQCHWARRTGHGIRTNDLRTLSAEAIEATFVDVHERLGVLSGYEAGIRRAPRRRLRLGKELACNRET